VNRYGASIYGTGASPFRALSWGRATRKSLPGNLTRLYLHVFDWPADGRLVVDGLLNQPRRAFLLGEAGERPLPIERSAETLVIRVPAAAPDAIDSVVALDVEGAVRVASGSRQ